MNTLDDLRATLAGHADDPVGAFDPRVTAVHARIARVRRRRRAGAAGGLALVLAVIGTGLATFLPQHRAAEPALAPGQVTVDGFDYQLGQTLAVDPAKRTLIVKLPATDQRRAVMLVGQGLGSGYATLDEDRQPVQRLLGSRPDGVPAFGVLSTPETLRVTLTNTPADAHVALAVYQRTPGEPVFRQQVESKTLLASTDNRSSGASSLTLRFHSAGGQIDTSDYCSSPAGTTVWYRVSMDDMRRSWARCPHGIPDEDAGQSSAGGFYVDPGVHTVRLTLSASPKGESLSFPGVRLGLAAYVDHYIRIPGTGPTGSVPARTDAYGLTWAPYPDASSAETAGFSVNGGPLMIGLLSHGRGMTRLKITDDAGNDTVSPWSGGDSGVWVSSIDAVLLPGSRYDVKIQHRGAGPHDARIVTYHPVSE